MLTGVMPLKISRKFRNDTERVKIFFSSLQKFCSPKIFEKIILIMPTSEIKEGKQLIEPWKKYFPIEIIDENQIIPQASKSLHPWFKQQLIKLAVAFIVKTPFYILFDSDVICTKMTHTHDFISDNKAALQLYPKTTFPPTRINWWLDSANLLELAPQMEQPGMVVTPAILAKDIVLGLCGCLQQKYQAPWFEVYHEAVTSLTDFRVFLRYFSKNLCRRLTHKKIVNMQRKLSCTEYTLYFLYANSQQLLERYHFFTKDKLLSIQGSVWKDTDFSSWQAADHFREDNPSHFIVIQSNKNTVVKEITNKILPHITPTINS